MLSSKNRVQLSQESCSETKGTVALVSKEIKPASQKMNSPTVSGLGSV